MRRITRRLTAVGSPRHPRMYVLDAGARVTQLRFLPDGRLLVGTWAAGDADLVILPLPAGPRVVIPLPVRQVWNELTRVAVPPAGDRLVTAFGGLRTHDTADGHEVPDGPSGPASRVVVSPDGQRFVVGYPDPPASRAVYGLADGERTWYTGHPRPFDPYPGGFLPDGERFVLVGGGTVSVCRFADRSTVASAGYTSRHVTHPQVSPDGRHLGVIGYHTFYVYDTAAPGEPRVITGGSKGREFVGFAFHPAGRTLAVIHGGPTLVKLYDLDTLTLRARLNWKVGELTCVGYSADGQLAAAGTDDGRVVVWDADE